MWIDDTKRIPFEEYKNIENRFFEAFSNMPGVVGYGSFGSVKAPGLSDLDLVVVVEKTVLQSNRFFLPPLEGVEKYVFQHSPMIIPAEILHLLPYYHLINVNWASRIPDHKMMVDDEALAKLGSLHVFEKTLYLQSFLWSLLYRAKRPCRQGILALTSVARSVEWLLRLGFPVKEADKLYVRNILALRAKWINSPNERCEQINALDRLLIQALYITIELPETIALHLLEIDKPSSTREDRYSGLHYRPMTFAFEANISDASSILEAVQNASIFNKIHAALGRLRSRVFGSYSVVGSVSFSILELEYMIEKNTRNSIYSYRWGPPASDSLHNRAKDRLSQILEQKYLANYEFAEILSLSGHSHANFGTVWKGSKMHSLRQMFLLNSFGRIRLSRAVHNKLPRT